MTVLIPDGYAIQVSSVTIYPGVSIRFLRLRAQLSQNCLHFSRKLQVPGCPKCLWLSSYESGFSQLAPRIWLFVITAHQAQWNTDLQSPVYFLVRDLIEDTDEQPDEATHISEGSWVQGLPSPGYWSIPLSWCMDVLTTQKVFKPYYSRDCFMKTSSHRHDPLLT